MELKDYDVVLMDLNYTRDTTSGEEGLDLLQRIHTADESLPVVVMTAWGSVNVAVEAMRRGARDFIQKPWDNERLLSIVRTQTELGRAIRRGRQLEAANQALMADGHSPLLAESAAMRPVLDIIARVGPSDANVLITGENGTGKGLVAQALHAVSPRANRPMVTVNAGGMAEGVFESELFGHMKGAFTDAKVDRVGRFELADGSTLFLDEIANVPLSQQAKLLRVIETGEFERLGSSKTRKVNVRLISATNADLNAEVAAGTFRQDLLFRLNTIEVHLPPLRDRREDIPLLARHFLRQHAQRYRKNLSGFDPAAMQVLLDHRWPGNVREIDHAVERAVLMSQGNTIRASDLGLRTEGTSTARLEDMSLEDVEAFLIKKAMARYGNVSQAARALGLSRSALYRRLERYKLVRGLAPTYASADPRSASPPPDARRRACPAVLTSLVILWTGDYTPKVQWTLTVLILGVPAWLSPRRCATASSCRCRRSPICSPRCAKTTSRFAAAPPIPEDPLGAVLIEVNALAETLHEQRLGAVEATALLRTVMEQVDVAVFAFDPDRAPAHRQSHGRAADGPQHGADARPHRRGAERHRLVRRCAARRRSVAARRQRRTLGSAPHDVPARRAAARSAGALGRQPAAARAGAAGVAAADSRHRPRARQLAGPDQVDRRQPRNAAAAQSAARGLARRHDARAAGHRVAHRVAEPVHRSLFAPRAPAGAEALRRSCSSRCW